MRTVGLPMSDGWATYVKVAPAQEAARLAALQKTHLRNPAGVNIRLHARSLRPHTRVVVGALQKTTTPAGVTLL